MVLKLYCYRNNLCKLTLLKLLGLFSLFKKLGIDKNIFTIACSHFFLP